MKIALRPKPAAGIFSAITVMFLIIIYSCQPEYTLNELKNLSKKSIGEITKGGYTFTLRHLPNELVALRSMQANCLEAYEEELESIENSISLILSIKNNDNARSPSFNASGNYSEYQEKIHNINFYLEENMQLSIGGNTVHPVLVNFQNAYNYKPIEEIYIVFPVLEGTNKLPERAQLTFNDEFFSNQTIQLGLNESVPLRKKLRFNDSTLKKCNDD